jgi:hypothetical protein
MKMPSGSRFRISNFKAYVEIGGEIWMKSEKE